MDAQLFWSKPDDKQKSPPTADMVARAEHVLGCKLPESYLALLSVRNGGLTSGLVCPTTAPTTWAADHVPVDFLNGIDDEYDNQGEGIISDAARVRAEWGSECIVPLCGRGHRWIVLDYRKDSGPLVAWMDAEAGRKLQLAESFDAFLAMLRPLSDVDQTAGLLKENVGRSFEVPVDQPIWAPSAEWNCPKCAEIVPESFTECWNCETPHPEMPGQ